MKALVSLTVFAIGLAVLTSYPAGAAVTGVAIAAALLFVSLATLSGAALGLVRLPADHDRRD